MNKIARKIIVVFLMLSFSVSLFATSASAETLYNETTESSSAYKKVLDPYNYTSARMMGMGGAGIAGFYNADSLYINPASLANKGVVVNLPAVSFTIYNLDTLNKYDVKFSEDDAKDAAVSYIADLASGKGYNSIADVSMNTSVKIKGFALGLDIKGSMLSYNASGNLSSFQAIPVVDMVASFGYGHRFFKESAITLDLGVAARATVREYFNSISYDDLVDVITANDSYDALTNMLDGNPGAIGFALPIDVAANLNLPYGITLSGVIRNLNGDRTYCYADEAKDLDAKYDSNKHKFSSDPTFNVGLGWKPRLGSLERYISPSFVFDLVDITSESSSNDFDNDKYLLSHTRIGAEVELFRFLKFRAGLSQGYVTVGAGFDIMNCFHVDAAYFTQEFGTGLGVKPVDAFTIRFSILHE